MDNNSRLPLKPEYFRWPYNGILSDLRAAIEGKANFLTALGLLIYTEVLGRDALRRRGKKSPSGEDSFYCFFKGFMGQETNHSTKIYEQYRHGMAHVYGFLAANSSIVRMNPDPNLVLSNDIMGIVESQDGKIKEFIVNAYFRDFQYGMLKFATQYPDILENRGRV